MTISFARHQFPPAIIRHAVWLYVRFTLSYRDVKICSPNVGSMCPTKQCGDGFEIRADVRPRTSTSTAAANVRWHLDEMAVAIAGRQFWLWRPVDDEGEVLDLLVQRPRDCAAAVKLMRKLLKKQGFSSDVLVTDKLRSYARQSPKWDCRPATNRGCAGTIGPRIRINRHGGASVRCNVSNRPDQPNGSCPFTPPSTTRSTSSVISLPAAYFVS
jgi:transposase-like protein